MKEKLELRMYGLFGYIEESNPYNEKILRVSNS